MPEQKKKGMFGSIFQDKKKDDAKYAEEKKKVGNCIYIHIHTRTHVYTC